MNSLNVEAGSSIAVFGTGAVGLSAVMAAQVVGCTKIIGIDVHADRLSLALELGATDVVQFSSLRKVEGLTIRSRQPLCLPLHARQSRF